MDRLYPVILPVPDEIRKLRGVDKTRELSRYARIALARSAAESSVVLGDLEKGERGRPLPSNGIHWSVSHTNDFVAAVTSPSPIGIDIEKIAHFSTPLQKKIADEDEWALAPVVDSGLFCRYWTAKEAVLKAVGAGLGGLAKCRIGHIPDTYHLHLCYQSQAWIVSHYYGIPEHVAAITVPGNQAEWRLCKT